MDLDQENTTGPNEVVSEIQPYLNKYERNLIKIGFLSKKINEPKRNAEEEEGENEPKKHWKLDWRILILLLSSGIQIVSCVLCVLHVLVFLLVLASFLQFEVVLIRSFCIE